MSIQIPSTQDCTGSFSAASTRDSRPLSDGKLVSKYAPALPGKGNVANKLKQVSNPVERHFDAPADRGSGIQRSSEMKVTAPSSPGPR